MTAHVGTKVLRNLGRRGSAMKPSIQTTSHVNRAVVWPKICLHSEFCRLVLKPVFRKFVCSMQRASRHLSGWALRHVASNRLWPEFGFLLHRMQSWCACRLRANQKVNWCSIPRLVCQSRFCVMPKIRCACVLINIPKGGPVATWYWTAKPEMPSWWKASCGDPQKSQCPRGFWPRWPIWWWQWFGLG